MNDLVLKCAAALIAGITIGAAVGVYIFKKRKKKENPMEVITYDEVMNKPSVNEVPLQPSDEEKEAYREAAGQYTSDISVISPDDFKEMYDTNLSFTYYSNGVIVDDDNNVFTESDIRKHFGDIDIPSHFGEYEPDSVCIRNDNLKADYEILRSNEAWKDCR